MGSVYRAIGPKAHPAMRIESSRRAVERREVRVGVSLIRNGTGCGGNMLGVLGSWKSFRGLPIPGHDIMAAVLLLGVPGLPRVFSEV